MNKLLAILFLTLSVLAGSNASALNTGEDIDKTILNLYEDLQYNSKRADAEIDMLRRSRADYWKRIVEIQQETDKAALVLSAQDGGSLFCVGLASEALSNVCNRFDKEKVPFENWLKTMTALSNRYNNIRRTLQQIHTQNLPPATLENITRSVAICDTLDARFAAMRDSIALDRQRYEKLSAEIHGIEAINREVVEEIREHIFMNNNEDFFSIFFSFNYSDMDFFYSDNTGSGLVGVVDDSTENKIDEWEQTIFLIAIVLSIILFFALRYALPKDNPFRVKRLYYALLSYLAVTTVGVYLMSWSIGLDDYMRHILDVCNDSYFFMFWMVLAATVRLKKPGIGWSVLSYLPLFILDSTLISFATSLTRSQVLKTSMPLLCLLFSVIALVILIVGAKRFLKSDYLAVFSSLGLIFVSTALVLPGYYYPSFILVLFGVSVMTYMAAFVCFKHFFGRRIKQRGPILHLTFSHLIYPLYFIFAFIQSLNEVANVFNLTTWLDDRMATPFINFPQYGVISASRVILLLVIGIIVNYIIKLVKLILIRIDKTKYETGTHAVVVTLCTMLAWFGFVILSLIVLQVNHGGVIAAVGGVSLGIGFAMKETFENLISGLQLMASRARPGDLVECDGQRGVIRHIGILSTQIEIEDGPIVSYPNRQLFSSTFTNLTLNNRREVRHIVFDIDADSDLSLARKLMLEASRGIDGVVDHDKHYIVMRNTNSGIVRLDYKCWIDSARYLRAEPAVREAIFNAFRANGIKIADLSNELGLHLTSTVTGKK